MLKDTFLWGTVAGLIHFVAVGALYQNPLVAGRYRRHAEHPGVRRWSSQPRYLAMMFLGTQVEVWILAGAFFYLAPFLQLGRGATALVLGLLFAGVRVYPRFFNMWIQTSYPRALLAVELVNGTLGTFVVTGALAILALK
jgi:hypothetical protein